MGLLQFEDQHPLIRAIFSGTVDDVKLTLSAHPDINYLDYEKRSTLHAAAFKGDAAIVSLLISCGARVNAKDSKWITPLHRACAVGADRVVDLLLQNEAIVSARDRQWQTPLHIAAASNALACVEILLNYIPNINVTDRAGRTALHHASANGHSNMVELLIAKGAIVNACDKKDFRPLHYAAQMGHLDTVEVLLGHGADFNAKDRNQCTPLHVAASTGANMVCRSLLTAGADVDAQNACSNTPLHLACLNGHLTVCQELVSFDASLEPVNYRGQTPLHIAAASAHGVDCLMYLIMDVDVNKQSSDGRTPLHMTAIYGRFTRSKTLIDEGAIIDCKDKSDCTPLHIAAQNGHDLLANTLLSHGANPMERGPEGRTPLHMCCLGGSVECCRKFLQANVDINALDDTGKTPLHCAAYKGSAECLDLLISNGADFTIADKIKRLPLHYAASQGHYQCLFTLVGVGSPTNAADFEGCTPLHLASAYDLEGRCIAYLLHHKADPLIRNSKKFTPLHYAVGGGNVKAVSFLLKAPGGASVFEQEGLPDVTPLHLAAKLGNTEILQNILSRYHRVNVQTDKGITPLMLAAREGHSKAVHMLLRSGANVAICDKVHGMTAVHYSAKNGHYQCLSLLLHNSESLNVVDMLDKYERTALMLAVSGNHIECVQILLKCGAQPNIIDKDKHSPLFRAVVNGQNSIVDLLLLNKALINKQDIHGKTVLHLAAACGHLVCLQVLLDHVKDEDVLLLDNQRCSVLHWACYNGQSSCLVCLLDRKIFKRLIGNEFSSVHCAAFAGSDTCVDLLVNNFGPEVVHLKDSRQRTPVHIAALHGHVQCVKYLAEKGAELDVVDQDGRTPLICAAQYGQGQVVELLLNHKINKTAMDNQGNTALHWACLKKHSFTALLILEYSGETSIVNISNNEKKTPLHLAVRNGLVDVTRELLRRGSSVLALDNDGYTPALCCAPNNNVAQCLGLILQNLAVLNSSSSMETDSVSLNTFFQANPEPGPKPLKSQTSQTDIVLVTDPDLFELKRYFNVRKHKRDKYKVQPLRDPVARFANDADLFVLETHDFNSGFVPDATKLVHGLMLHKSYSDMSIASKPAGGGKNVSPQKWLGDVAEKKRNCRECYRLQHRCKDCTLRYMLRLHVQGKTTNRSFNEFISKSLTEASPIYRQKLLQAISVVQKEFEQAESSPIKKRSPKKFERSKSFDAPNPRMCNYGEMAKRRRINSMDQKRIEVFENDFRLLGGNPISENSNSGIPMSAAENNENLVKFLDGENDVSSDDNAQEDCCCEDTTECERDHVSCCQKEHCIEHSMQQSPEGDKGDRNESGIVGVDGKREKDIKPTISLNDEFLRYLKSVKLGYDKTRDEEYFKALSSYMNYMLQKFDRDFELQKELEQNYKSCAKYQEMNRGLQRDIDHVSLMKKSRMRPGSVHYECKRNPSHKAFAGGIKISTLNCQNEVPSKNGDNSLHAMENDKSDNPDKLAPVADSTNIRRTTNEMTSLTVINKMLTESQIKADGSQDFSKEQLIENPVPIKHNVEPYPQNNIKTQHQGITSGTQQEMKLCQNEISLSTPSSCNDTPGVDPYLHTDRGTKHIDEVGKNVNVLKEHDEIGRCTAVQDAGLSEVPARDSGNKVTPEGDAVTMEETAEMKCTKGSSVSSFQDILVEDKSQSDDTKSIEARSTKKWKLKELSCIVS